MNNSRTRAILEIAINQHTGSDDIELDEDVLVSEGEDNGAWVRAWIWADFNGTTLDKEVENED